jgi:hypothetical protein
MKACFVDKEGSFWNDRQQQTTFTFMFVIVGRGWASERILVESWVPDFIPFL